MYARLPNALKRVFSARYSLILRAGACSTFLQARVNLGLRRSAAVRKAAPLWTRRMPSLNLVRKNLESTDLSEKAKVVRSDYAAFAAASRDTFDIVFLDPPYSAGLLMPAVKAVLPLMSDYGVIVCEHPPEVKLDEEIGGFKIAKAYRYGKVLVTVYRKGESV